MRESQGRDSSSGAELQHLDLGRRASDMAVLEFRHVCDTCGGRAKKLLVLRDEDRPRVGDLSVCSRCNTIGRFTHEGDVRHLVALTPSEINTVRLEDPEAFDVLLKGLEAFRRRN